MELRLAWQCRRWNALPLDVLAQPAGLLDRMATAEDVYDAVSGFEHIRPGTGAAWVDANPGAWQLVQELYGWI